MDESEKSSSASGSDKESLTEGEEQALDDIEEESDENEPKIDELKPLGIPKNKRTWKKLN